jgi:CRISPR-associated protein Cmr1
MPKEIPKCPEKPTSPPQTKPISVEVVTPMVGGGVTAGETDLQFPVRPTAIRGHLRHWWRLTVGRFIGAGMWQREEEIFGSTEFPSPLVIRVTKWSRPEQFDPSNRDVMDQFGPVAYALFASIENGHPVAAEGITFDLLVHTPAEEELNRRRAAQNDQRKKAKKDPLPPTISPIGQDIDSALRAWLTFGGLGGRTRRGCGALHSAALTGNLPTIPGRLFVGPPQGSALEAWKQALQAYRDFRQTPRGRIHAKTLKSGKTAQVPGRSHWPEADSIRQVTGCSLKPSSSSAPTGVPADEDPHDHSTPMVPPETLPSFPKAVLGLPVNFHFADGPGKNRPAVPNLDPQDVQLYPLVPAAQGKWEKAERMASPVITRPLWLDKKWHPLVLILDQPLPDGFKLRVEGKNAVVGGNLSHDMPLSRVVDTSLGRLAPMRGQANAIDALIKYLTEERKWSPL